MTDGKHEPRHRRITLGGEPYYAAAIILVLVFCLWVFLP